MIWVNGRQLVTEFKHVAGRRGAGSSALLVQLEFQPTSSLLGCSLLLDGSISFGPSGGGMAYAGHLSSRGNTAVFLQDGAGDWITPRTELMVDLSHQQLTAIEELRRGSEIQVYCDVQGLLFDKEGRVTAVSGQLEYRMDAASWSRVLQEMDFAKSVTVTIPLEGHDLTSRRRQAASRLEKAQTLISQGQYKQAVHECRGLLESLFVEPDAAYSDFKPQFPNVRRATKEARFYFIREALLQITHAASHEDEVTRHIQWTRNDAVAVVGVLSALLLQEG